MVSSASKLFVAAAAFFLSRAVQAVPAPAPAPAPEPTQALELRAEATDAWVTVDSTGLPKTVTPVVTASDGVPTTISAIPIELTATVLTRTAYGEVTTSTGTAAAQPTADNKKGKGSFLACSNTDGDYAPFCEPAKNSSLYVGTTYYVTWDRSVLNSTKVTVTGTYLNATTGEATEDDAFTTDDIKASWSYYAWTPNSGYLKHGNGKAVNVTLVLKELDSDGETVTKTYAGPTVLVTKAPTYHQSAPKLPAGAALYIGLPVILGFCALMVCGVCAWNRQSRRIGLGNIMSRSRHGYGIAKSRAKRMTRNMRGGGGRAAKKQAMHNIRLMDNLPEESMYRDEPQRFDGDRDYHYDADPTELRIDGRRDSDLGSLVGTPTGEQFPRSHGGNAFRDELERQRRERE